MIVRELFAKLGMDVDAASFAEAGLAVEAVKGGLEWLKEKATEAFHAMEELVVGAAEYRHELAEMSVRTGVGTDALQKMAYAASFSGVTLDDLGVAMNMMAKKGVHDVEGAMLRLADQLHGMPADGRRAELAMNMIGRAGGKMVPILAKGREELEELFAEAPLLTKEQIAAGSHFTEQMMKLQKFAQPWKAMSTPLIDAINPILDQLRAWQVENGALMRQRFKEWGVKLGKAIKWVWSVVVDLKDALAWLGKNLKLVAAVVLSVAAAWAILSAIQLASLFGWGAILTAIWATVSGFIAMAVAAVASWIAILWPVALVAAGILLLLGLLEDIYMWVTGKQSLLGDMFGTWEDASAAFFPWLADLFVSFLDWVDEWGDKLGDMFVDALKWVWDNFSEGLGRIASGLWEAISGYFDMTVSNVKRDVGKLIDWVLSKITGIPSAIMGGAAAGVLSMLPGGSLLAPAAALFGGGASPAASAAVASVGAGGASSSTSSTTGNASLVAPITINQQPGQSSKALALDVRDVLEDMHQKQLREALAAHGGAQP